MATALLDPAKFRDPLVTARGDRRAVVALKGLETLWINTGTLCNITCSHCYIESSPTNDRLAYITLAECMAYLDEITRDRLPVREIGFTGGEPFMNPDMVPMLGLALDRGFQALVLTNAMKPMTHKRGDLKRLLAAYGGRLVMRVSLDHYDEGRHDQERGAGSFAQALDGMIWLSREGFRLHVAGRMGFGESEAQMRAGFAALFTARGLAVDAADPVALTLFPEMDANLDVPEITEGCWGILKRHPSSVMCASSRMVVKRKGAARPAVLACTLIPYDERFELGSTLAEAAGPVPLNHPHCARFCVLGGASCSRGPDGG